MLTVGILILLAIAFYSGARRGLVLQATYTLGYFISYIVARMNYRELGEKLELLIPYPSATQDSQMVFFSQEQALDLAGAFYAGVAFLLILGIGWLATRFIAIFFRELLFVSVAKKLDGLLGGILCAVVVYLGIFFILTIASYIPIPMIQSQFESGLARTIVEHTPIFSKQILQLWVTDIIG
ncbi:putative membrane protein required for colicin V production [Enterococcus sp. PF1-24]|uniref:CvpA family protein n=1 Tax=unclassified Enterococcus TaxID=2608891 RepID=UPI0024772B95|nr:MULTISPECIES: CvpA family protein [unclassified Enterococcus]MDH6364567.1 putative membrane protein required for colicin V production [Enterococcus sp. PFB1-1]MDH6401668.1 putative membrane protein required for colicin V production [Enterococcus sp. PF1-24]